jgi:hypothetical protein
VGALALLDAGPLGRPPAVDAASLNLTWETPTTNANGTPLSDLVKYRVYVALSSPACGGPSFIEVLSPVAAPPQPQTVAFRVPGLSAGTTYAVAVSAINASDYESACSSEAIGVAQTEFGVGPASVDFGVAMLGSAVDRTFTVQNVGAVPLSGTATASGPFSVVLGSPFNIAPGTAQDVVVRFEPSLEGTFVANVNFMVDADTISRGVTGTAMLPAEPPPPGPASLVVGYAGKLRDRVGPGHAYVTPDGVPDATLTAVLSASGGRTVTRLRLQSSGGGTWDSDASSGAWTLGAAIAMDGALLNDPGTGAVSFPVTDGGSFRLFFASVFDGVDFVAGRTVTLTATFSDGTTAAAQTTVTAAPSLTLTYDGTLRDHVGSGNLGLGPDGAPDGTLTATLSASGGRTITGLALESSVPGTWDTDGATTAWVLGVAPTLDGALLNDPATMTVSFTVDDGGSFRVFASDFAGIEFVPGTRLTLTATFADGTTAVGSTSVATPPSLVLTFGGSLRDRVGQGPGALEADGTADTTLLATLSASGGRAITQLTLQSSGPGTWNTGAEGGAWVLGVATTLDAPLLNDPVTGAANFALADSDSVFLFLASTFGGADFVAGATLTLTAAFSDGSTTVTAVAIPPSLSLTYDGKPRDRVGPGTVGLGPDGALDGTLTATLTAAGNRTVTRLRLQSSAPGSWDTDASTSAWALGAASTPDGPLLNDPTTMAVGFPVPGGGSFTVFAADYADIEFVPGTILTLTVTFSDGTEMMATTVVSAVATPSPPSLRLSYNGTLRDRVGYGSDALGPDGAPDGTLTAVLNATGGRTVTRLHLQSSAPGTWDTEVSTPAWVVGVASTLDGPLVNDPDTMNVWLPVADGMGFVLFASDFAGIEFIPGTTLTLTATFSDETTATATTVVGSVSLTLRYDGKLRDRLDNFGLSPDGAPDGTLTATLDAMDGRTVTLLQLQNSDVTWDTTEASGWVLGVASTLDGPLLNDPGTMAVSLPVGDGGSFHLFASDLADFQFVPGTTLTLLATFSDGTTATATAVIPP